MRKFMIFCSIITIIAAADQGYNYKPELDNSSSSNLEPAKETEYFLYTAPDDINDVIDSKRLANLLHPQRVIFIKNPENKIFSLAAEQLAKQQSLNIYVLQRQTDNADLQSQLQEIRERQKPRVQFIKYRTPEDIERAKQAVYNDFESIPGSSKFHQNQQTPVYEFDGKSQQFRSVQQERPTQPPVIFEIIKRPTEAPILKESSVESITMLKDTSVEAVSTKPLKYLPPSLN
ncbi:uncharacterized protein LOC119616448 [Lucilia sericata]|uniref:uncharacterized protein LOC119616448 n=1 Tax=Lucilia sericata TaxID=13632 RepID=UPI0018A82C8F|nr:uncharacterized protein LOC119616448 [Lucilia sericata]